MPGSPTLPEIAAREVRAEMGRQKISGAALAQTLGVSDMYVSRRLNGEVPFDLAELERVAAALSVPVTQFLPAEVAA
jgi:transcriptional regulator with XRE-family HTH domain